MNFIDKMVERFMKLNRRMKRWKRAVSVMAAVVVFVTTYMMILPAITLDVEAASTQAGMESVETAPASTQAGMESVETAPEQEENKESFGAEQEEDSGSDSGSREAEEEQDDADHSDAAGEDTDSEIGEGGEENVLTDQDTDTVGDDETNGGDAEANADDETEMLSEEADTASTEMAAPEIELITEETQLTFETDDYIVYADFGEAARLPVGVELRVREITKESDPEAYQAYYELALSQMQDKYDEYSTLSFARFYDVTFVYEEAEIEPSGDVKVRIEYKNVINVASDTTVDAIHFDKEDEENAEVIDSEVETESVEQKRSKKASEGKTEPETVVKAVEFESDRFSVYGIVGTQTIITQYITAEGETYVITVTYGPDAEIPDDTVLDVKEISEESESFAQYSADAAATIYENEKYALPYVRFFDISIRNGEEEIEPAAPVQVKIRLMDGSMEETANGAQFSAVHFTEDGTEAIEVDNIQDAGGSAEAISFEADSFSVYGIAFTYTVDYFYEEAEYHQVGGSTMQLSTLFEELGIQQQVSEAVQVEFSTPELLRVEEAEEDWNLVSLRPFLTSETLTVTFTDGTEIVIGVTDDILSWQNIRNYNARWMIDDEGTLILDTREGVSSSRFPAYSEAALCPWHNYRNQIKAVRTNGHQLVVYGKDSTQPGGYDPSVYSPMNSMFGSCPNLETVDLSDFYTKYVTEMKYLFSGSPNIKSITFGNQFSTENVSSMYYMFNGCSSLTDLDLSGFNVSKVTNMGSMFSGCTGLKTLNLNGWKWNTGLSSIGSLFSDLSSLETLDVSDWTIPSGISNISTLFTGLSGSLKNLDASGWSLPGATAMTSLFNGLTSLETLDVSNWSMPNCTDISGLFKNLTSLKTIDISGWNTSNVTNMAELFRNCTSLESLDLSSFDTSKVTNMSLMFYYCIALTDLDVSSFNTSRVTNMGQMFDYCTSIERLELNNFDTRNVTNMNSMFHYMSSLKHLDVGSFETPNVTIVGSIFGANMQLEYLDIRNFDTTNITSSSQVFSDDYRLSTIIIGDKWRYYTSHNFFWPFPKGVWERTAPGGTVEVKTGQEFGIYMRDIGSAPGTYVKINDNPFGVPYPVTYRVDDIRGYTPIVSVSGSTYSYDSEQNMVLFDYTSSSAGAELTMPGSFTLLYKDAVTDADGNKYDLEMTISDVWLGNLSLSSTRRVRGGLMGIADSYMGLFFDQPYLISENVGGSTNLRMNVTERVVKDGVPQEGSFIYAAYDLDGTGRSGYDQYAEGVNLIDGFDENTITVSKPETYIQLKGYSSLWDGYRIVGSAIDSNTDLSEFIVKVTEADDFVWQFTTTGGMKTILAAQYQPEQIYLKKTDENGDRVANASLSLWSVEKNNDGTLKVVQTASGYTYDETTLTQETNWNWTTTATQDKSVFLVPGYYLMRETVTPTGYRTAEEKLFRVDNDYKIHAVSIDSSTGTVSEAAPDPDGAARIVRMTDYPLSNTVTIRKTDKNTGSALAGAGFTLSGTSTYMGTVTRTGTTDADGILTFSYVPLGTYTLSETTVPDNYIQVEDRTVVIDTDGQTITYDIADIPVVDLTVTKKLMSGDQQTEFDFTVIIVKDYEFTLPVSTDYSTVYSADHKTATVTFNLKHNESVTITEIPKASNVTITETNHDGYTVFFKENDVTIGAGYTYTISSIDTTRSIEVNNNPGYELPSTGGSGTLPYTLGGLMLILASALMYGFRMRRRERRCL